MGLETGDMSETSSFPLASPGAFGASSLRNDMKSATKQSTRALACASLGVLVMWWAGHTLGGEPPSTTNSVGIQGTNLYSTPVHQMLTPAGRQLELPELRPQVLALSPNHRLLAVAGKTAELLLVDPATRLVIQRLPLPASTGAEPLADPVSTHLLKPDKEAQASYTGLVFSPAGDRIYLSSVNGTVKVFQVAPDGKVSGLASIPLPPADAPRRKVEIPAGLAISPDGTRLYVALTLGNRLAEINTRTGAVLRLWEVGFAPYDVVLVRGKAYVSNWGGRRPEAGTLTGPAGRGTRVRVDTVRHIASEGSVSVVDLAARPADPATPLTAQVEILTGLHASALALAPDGRHLVVANAGSDTLSVIDTRKDAVVETFTARENPADLFGASPNALAFGPAGRLYVCNGTQNAVAVFDFSPGRSRWLGMIPVGWFPGAIVYDPARKELEVANIKGIGSGRRLGAGDKVKFNSHQYLGSLSFVPLPSTRELAGQTASVRRNMRYPLLAEARRPARAGQPAVPVPARAGEPSVFKHVVYLIKENRTYDQVLGDVTPGNGDPSLCVFGEKVTPNQHKMTRDFVLLDNTYCSGILSADGHQWADSAMATDYMEKSFAGFPRSYPDGMEDDDLDALAYSPAGFLWDNAIQHGRTLRDYGEFAITDTSWLDPGNKKPIRFLSHWHDFTNGTATLRVQSRPAIESLRPYLCPAAAGWDLAVPDVTRAREFIRELHEFERRGSFPNLVIICLPNDHTSGTSPGSPTPAAQAADNDLAFGQILEALSHSRFWPETCVFAIEDDPQSGWDHVSGYRTTAYVASPYTKRGQVVSTQYNQASLVRTMELMLGLPPMNIFDATATPMTDCFVGSPDLRPFDAVTNNLPLDQMNPDPKKVADATLRHDALISARLPLAAPDRCPEDLLNHILWRAMRGSSAPYPVWAVSTTEDLD